MSTNTQQWAVVVRHEITRETYVVAPFDVAEDAFSRMQELAAADSMQRALVVRLVKS